MLMMLRIACTVVSKYYHIADAADQLLHTILPARFHWERLPES
jgi:hypothetical protein